MRHPYTPVFRDFLTSSMWAQSSDTRVVWIWMLLMADPEGYVAGTIPGIAQQAGVSLEACKAAIELLESPDPYSSTPEHEGRRIIKVQRGWHITTFVAHRERAKHEAEKARKRAWAKKDAEDKRQLTLPGFPTSDDLPPVLDAPSETLDAPKPKPKPKPKEGEEGTPPPARGDLVESRHLVLDKLPDEWQLSDELRAAAVIAGVPPGDIDARINDLRLGPIGGTRGVFAHKVDAYIKQQFGKWKTWAEVDRAKALSRAATGAPKRFGGGEPPLEPTGAERAHAAKFGYDIDEVFRALNEQDCVTRLGREGARDEAKRRMKAAAKAAKERAA